MDALVEHMNGSRYKTLENPRPRVTRQGELR
jgi:hypothetical protein